ncbi:aldehyde dehydrogenase family protein [Williamsia sp. CHRR-6]|nr:aldehyde dehydrogenase family protein [Williamsia sp. CHRR-6]
MDGKWTPSDRTELIHVVNPSTEVGLGTVTVATQSDVDRAVEAARRALGPWSSLTNAERAEALERVADALEKRGSEIAESVSRQNGMPIAVLTGLEAGFPPLLLRYYAGLVADQPTVTRRAGLLGGQIDFVRKPMGVVGVIVPWNFPQTLAWMKIAPALATGNVVVVEPSPETVLDSLLIVDALEEAGLPAGVANIVFGDAEVGQAIVGHPGVDRVAFTGSTEVGRSIAQTCGQLLRPVSLELGGKSATVILDDADHRPRRGTTGHRGLRTGEHVSPVLGIGHRTGQPIATADARRHQFRGCPVGSVRHGDRRPHLHGIDGVGCRRCRRRWRGGEHVNTA